MRGSSYGITNFVSRPFASLATIVVEYTNDPLLFVLPLALLALYGVDNIREVDWENGWVTASGSKDMLDGEVDHQESVLHLKNDDEYVAVHNGHKDDTVAAITNKVWGEGVIKKVSKNEEIDRVEK